MFGILDSKDRQSLCTLQGLGSSGRAKQGCCASFLLLVVEAFLWQLSPRPYTPKLEACTSSNQSLEGFRFSCSSTSEKSRWILIREISKTSCRRRETFEGTCRCASMKAVLRGMREQQPDTLNPIPARKPSEASIKRSVCRGREDLGFN